jgi:hypothetical protein
VSAQRLPHPGGDNGDWGDILNGFLGVSHNNDGTLSSNAIIDAGAITQVNGVTPSSGVITLGESNIANLSSDLANRVQLGGDLGGTTTAPILTATSNVESIITANSTVAGAVQQSSVISANSIRPTTGAPAALSTDQAGDFAYDSSANVMYGPFSGNGISGTWPSGTLLGSNFTGTTIVNTSPVTMTPNTIYLANSGASILNLPASVVPGQMFALQRGSATGTLTISEGSLLINGVNQGLTLSGSGATADVGFVWLIAVSSSNLLVVAMSGTDASLGMQIKGTLTLAGPLITHNTTKTANYTTLTTDFWVRATSGSFTITMGTTSFAASQIQMVTNEGTGTITLAAVTGTIDLTTLPPASGVILAFDGTNWHTIGSWNTTQAIQYITSSSTVTLQAGTYLITALGGGGSGGGGGAAALTGGVTTQVGGGGGGQGQYVQQPIVLSGATTLTITIGAGGTAVSGGTASTGATGNAGTVGNVGGNTSITGTGVSITAAGGGYGNPGGANSTTTVGGGGYASRNSAATTTSDYISGAGGPATSSTGQAPTGAIGVAGFNGGGGGPATSSLGGVAGTITGSNTTGNAGTITGGNGTNQPANSGLGGPGGGGGAPGGAGGNSGAGGSGFVLIEAA